MKRVLIVYYTQSGQLRRILDAMLAPLARANGVELTWWLLQPTTPYPFPWPIPRFLDVFPESVLMVPPALDPLPPAPTTTFDLVVLAYTAWYLAPSTPMSAFLASPAAEVMRGRPVITVVNGRDKWLTAQELVKEKLAEREARLIDNVAFIHVGNVFQHTVTTLRWMWTGRQSAFWGFPAAGVSEVDIRNASRFGDAIRRALDQGATESSMLQGLGAVHVDDDTILQEQVARVIFRAWARWIRAAGRLGRSARWLALLLFGAFLVSLILLAAPIVLVHKVLIAPFRREAAARKRAYYEQPSGSARDRIEPGAGFRPV